MYLDGRRNERDDPRVQAVLRALEESPEDLGSADRRSLLWQGLNEGVEDPVRITAGGTGSREVPEHLDRTLATIESSFHSTLGLNTTCFLMSVARSKNEYLMHPPSPQGPCQRAAVAHSLVLVYDEIDRRTAQASLGRGGQPDVECLEWDPDDPLGGDLNGISPFGNYDAWNAIELTVTTRSGRVNGTRTRIWTGLDDQEEVPIADVMQRLLLQCDRNTFASWFLRYYTNCMRLNPHTVDPVGGTWRVPGATGSRTSVTFRQSMRASDEAELRELLDTGQRITVENEDGIAFFGDARRGLQRTIDYWDTIRLADQDDDRASYRQRAEYQNFSQLMAFDPHRMDYHGRGVP